MIKIKLDIKTKELVAIAASIIANCQPCIKYHLKVAKEVKISKEEIDEAIELAKAIKVNSSKIMDKFTEEILNGKSDEKECCSEKKQNNGDKLPGSFSCCGWINFSETLTFFPSDLILYYLFFWN